MNVYVCIRTILHSLLFLVNLIALTIAAGIVTTLRGQGHKATAGSVLVILATVFYAIITIGTWSETCIPRSKLSRNRTEAITLPILFLFQLITAIVTTAETSKGSCTDQSLCVALLALSWMTTVTLLVYYLITMVVIFHHFSLHENLWDESPLSYNWFPVPSTRPVVPPKDLIVNPPRQIAGAPSIEIASIEPPPPSFLGHQRQRSSWMPPPLDLASKMRDLRGPTGGATQEVNAGGGPEGATDAFEEIPIGPAPAMEDGDGASRFSFTVPSWARKLRGARRGVEAPFPLTAATTFHRSRDESPHNIDAPVSPTSFPDNEFMSS